MSQAQRIYVDLKNRNVYVGNKVVIDLTSSDNDDEVTDINQNEGWVDEPEEWMRVSQRADAWQYKCYSGPVNKILPEIIDLTQYDSPRGSGVPFVDAVLNPVWRGAGSPKSKDPMENVVLCDKALARELITPRVVKRIKVDDEVDYLALSLASDLIPTVKQSPKHEIGSAFAKRELTKEFGVEIGKALDFLGE